MELCMTYGYDYGIPNADMLWNCSDGNNNF
jgi:hypothetical protein